MPDYEEKLLALLCGRYRSSKKDSGTNRNNRRTLIKPKDLYRDYDHNDGDMDHIEAVNLAAEKCRDMGFITFEMKGFSNEISVIYLVDARIDDVEQYLSSTFHYETKHDKLQYVTGMIARYGGRGPVADRECHRLQASLDKNCVPKQYMQTEDVLKALVFIEENRRPLYIREASMLIYGSSKYLEENCLDTVCRLLRDHLKRPCGDDELPDEILAEYGILKEKQKLCLKGDVTVIKSGVKTELGTFPGGIEFYADELEQIAQITVHGARLISVENRTAYLRCQAKDTVFFYLGGYANRFQRDFLKAVYRQNPTIEYMHFGDMDAGGFFIHEHLCRVTGISFKLLAMSIDVLKDARYAACLLPLTDNDRKRLRTLAKQETYRDVAEYMLERGVKLEQEIVSYYGEFANEYRSI